MLGIGILVIMGCMSILWLISLRLKDSSIVDIFWGPGFVILTSLYLMLVHEYEARGILLLFLVAVWGARLAVHIAVRNRGKGEDKRYRSFRQAGGQGRPGAEQRRPHPDR